MQIELIVAIDELEKDIHDHLLTCETCLADENCNLYRALVYEQSCYTRELQELEEAE